ncbi:MAG: peptide-methionine (S)-S-oxide reductase MsrA [Candidatus Pacebacteria bacterium]|nr:peptide-methionine (S)-S-oxide reductase MsrA [Candidatus Paceibacterota bacterium]
MTESSDTEIAVIGGGCFWCTEAVFKMLRGVSSVLPGYAGGEKPNPSYEDVCAGMTGHAEVIQIKFDPAQVKFEDLLTVFFASHDPTTMNRQGNDVGTQYRSIILYTTGEQKIKAENFIKELNASNPNGKPIVTEIKPLETFYEAENYHQNYFARNPGNPYCEVIINPKLEKVQEKFANLLADKSKQK